MRWQNPFLFFFVTTVNKAGMPVLEVASQLPEEAKEYTVLLGREERARQESCGAMIKSAAKLS